MISRETAAKIWNAYREIEAAEKLLIKVEETLKDFESDNSLPSLKDISREARRFEFGVPSGENSHRLFGVSPTLAEAVIREVKSSTNYLHGFVTVWIAVLNLTLNQTKILLK